MGTVPHSWSTLCLKAHGTEHGLRCAASNVGSDGHVFGRLEYDGVAAHQRRTHRPRYHTSGEFHRMLGHTCVHQPLWSTYLPAHSIDKAGMVTRQRDCSST